MTKPEVELRLAGSPFEMGFQQGRAFAGEIAEQLVSLVGETGDGASRAAWLSRSLAILERDLPEMAEELAGLAEGAEVSIEDAALLQYRRELHPNAAELGGCTTWASVTGMPVLAQTIDLAPEMSRHARVLRVVRGERQTLVCTFAGLLGFAGLNDAGLAAGLNFVRSDGWRPGVSPYLLARRLLACEGIDACVDEIRRVRRSSSRVFTLVCGERAVMVETTPDEVVVVEDSAFVRANHYLSAELSPLDRLNVFSRNASRRRQARLADRVPALAELPGVDDVFDLFADHSLWPVGICAHAEAGARDDTVAAVVMLPRAGELHLRRGHVCEAPTHAHSLQPPCRPTSNEDLPRMTRSRTEIQQWLLEDVAARAQLPIEEIDSTADLSDYALDSSEAVELALALEAWLGIELDMTLLWEEHTIDAVVEAVLKVVAEASETAHV